MTVKSARILPALLVLLVLLVSQVAYAAGAFERAAASDHCARSAPPEPSEQPCRLPLWLTCCDDHAAVSMGAGAIGPGAQLVLPLATALVPASAAVALPIAARAEIPPDTPLSHSSVLLI